ncbi:hypothetical protein C8J56DRAFT_1053668 [Mycena floridula]|nr:hypothetical protein C8J56DRAFT_1053668 [Mycena floridula]
MSFDSPSIFTFLFGLPSSMAVNWIVRSVSHPSLSSLTCLYAQRTLGGIQCFPMQGIKIMKPLALVHSASPRGYMSRDPGSLKCSSRTAIDITQALQSAPLGQLWLIASSVYLPQYCQTAVQRSAITGITKGTDFVTGMMLFECSPLKVFWHGGQGPSRSASHEAKNNLEAREKQRESPAAPISPFNHRRPWLARAIAGIVRETDHGAATVLWHPFAAIPFFPSPVRIIIHGAYRGKTETIDGKRCRARHFTSAKMVNES